MSKTTGDTRGRRYSTSEKARVLEYIHQVNLAKGHGGQAAAHREFGVAHVTIKLWMQKGPGITDSSFPSSDAVAQKLSHMSSIAKRIESLEGALARMRKEYETLERELSSLHLG